MILSILLINWSSTFLFNKSLSSIGLDMLPQLLKKNYMLFLFINVLSTWKRETWVHCVVMLETSDSLSCYLSNLSKDINTWKWQFTQFIVSLYFSEGIYGSMCSMCSIFLIFLTLSPTTSKQTCCENFVVPENFSGCLVYRFTIVIQWLKSIIIGSH